MTLTALLLAPLSLQSSFDETLVFDLNATPAADQVTSFAATVTDGSTAYFPVEFENRWQMAASDGSLSGTRVLASASPGIPDFDLTGPARFAAAFLPGGSGRAVAAGDTFGVGFEPWLLDAGGEEVRRIADVRAGAEGSLPESFVAFGDAVWFLADDGVHGRELWRTDGTTSGTVLAIDTVPGPGSLWPTPDLGRQVLATNGTALWFFAPNGGDYDLWVTDGTAAGLQLLASAIESIQGSDLFRLGRSGLAGDSLLFTTDAGLWVSDATVGGTQLLEPGDVRWVVSDGARAFVAFEAGSTGRLIVTDGSSVGTTELAGPSTLGDVFGALDRRGAMLGGELVFASSTASAGFEPCITDGTPEGTRVLADLSPGPGTVVGSQPFDFEFFDGRVYFTATGGGVPVRRIWSTDGTSVGTQPVPATLGADDVFPVDLAAGKLSPFRPAEHGLLHLLQSDQFSVDGSLESWSVGAAGSVPVPIASEGTRGASPRELTRVGDRLFFSASASGDAGLRDLFVFDASLGGAPVRIDALPADVALAPTDLVSWMGGVAFFGRSSAATDTRGVWWTDGQTSRLLTPLDLDRDLRELAPAGDRLYIAVDVPQAPSNVLVSFGAAGDATIVDLDPVGTYVALTGLAGTADGRLFGAGVDTGLLGDNELFVFDGTSTVRIDIQPGIVPSFPSDITVVGEQAFFEAGTTASGRELWFTDGTPGGTVQLTDIVPPSPNSQAIVDIAPIGIGVLARYAADPEQYLIASDGTPGGTSLLALPVNADADSWPEILVNGDVAYLDWGDPASIWTTNGASQGTAPAPGLAASLGPWAGPPADVGLDRFAFSQEQSTTRALWTVDGSAAGTSLLTAYSDGDESVVPQVRPVQVGDALYFVAEDLATGEELHRVELGTLGIADVTVQEGGCGVGQDALDVAGIPAVGQSISVVVDGQLPLMAVTFFAGTDLLLSTPGQCAIEHAPTIALGSAITNGAGVASLDLAIPDQPSLVGRVLHFQSLVVVPAGPFFGVGATTNTATVLIGQ